MQAPVDTPLKRASVSERHVLAEVEVLQRGRELVRLLHAGAHRAAADEHQDVACLDLPALDRRDGCRLGHEDPRRPAESIDAVCAHDGRVDRRALDHRAVRRQVAVRQAHRRRASPRADAAVGRHDHVVGVDAVERAQALAEALRGARMLPRRRAVRPASCRQPSGRDVSSSPARRRCSITSGTPPARNTCTVGMVARPVRQRVDEPRHAAADFRPVARGRPRKPAPRGRSPARAAAGWSIRRTRRGRPLRCGRAAGVRMSRDRGCRALRASSARVPSAAPCRARSADRTGASAAWPQRQTERLADHLGRRCGTEELAAAARRRAGAAPEVGCLLERDLAVHEADADALHAPRVLAFDRQERDAARHQHARQVVARRRAPSSSPAGPCRTSPRRGHRGDVGSDRISRRNTVAASFRYGRLSNIAAVPCERPSHGSVQEAANGMAPARLNSRGCRLDEQPDLPVSGVIPEGDRCPVGCTDAAVRGQHQELRARRAPTASQPMPAFCVHPKRSPDGRSRSISGVSGSDPAGPAACVVTFRIARSCVSKGFVGTGATVYQAGSDQPGAEPYRRLAAPRKSGIPVALGEGSRARSSLWMADEQPSSRRGVP